MTSDERQSIKRAAHSVVEMTATYCGLVQKQMEKSDGGTEQMQEIHESLRALNHATIAMERLCRILDDAEPGKIEGS